VKKKVVKKKTVKKKKITKKKKVVKKKKIKKKAVKKKIIKKKSIKKKKTKKKKKRVRRKRKKILMEDIYVIINKVQLKKKKVVFATDIIETLTIENTIKDAELKYNKIEMKTQTVFILYPDEEKEYGQDEDMFDLEMIDDEIPDIGQIF
jgi:hypothetical protein